MTKKENKLKRPHVVEVWSNIHNWPKEAIEALHKGLNVTAIQNNLWNIRCMKHDAPIAVCAKDEIPAMPPIAETIIEVNTLRSRAAFGYGGFRREEIARQATYMNESLKERAPIKVFIQTDSYRLRKQGLLRPKWTVKASLRYWRAKLLGKPVRWNTFSGKRWIELSLSVNVGILQE